MASVSSLDQDMRNLRMSRYTPQAANEVRTWIEETLAERLPPGDLLDVLKDGVALCKLANLVLPPPGVKYKASGMPFIQMENISHFLKACEMPPLNLPAHDRFLTVDLFESKDPAQVLQCLGAFSRQAHAAAPNKFRTTIGPKKAGGGVVSPGSTGGRPGMNGGGSFRNSTYGRPASPTKPSAAMPSSARAMTPNLTGGSTGSQTSNATNVSSWSSRKDEGVTSPAWNIHQYGYMGGASQGNQGISFGARRQITSQSPAVPSLAEKERKRKEKAEEDARLRQQAEEAEHRRRVEREAEEERERVEEERRWEEETRRVREEERRRVEEQKRQWEEQERRWQVEEEARRKEEADVQATLMPKKPPEKPRVSSSSILRGQTLSQYQREATPANGASAEEVETPEQRRVRELEKQLEEARERERQYQAEREERLKQEKERSRPSTAQTETGETQSVKGSEASWAPDEREFLRTQWQNGQSVTTTPAKPAPAPAPIPERRPVPAQPPNLPSRPLPQPSIEEPEEPQEAEPEDEPPSSPPSLPSRPHQQLQPTTSTSSIPTFNPSSAPTSSPLGSANRPLPTPEKTYEPYSPETQKPNRTDRFLATAPPAPTPSRPRISSAQEAGDSSLEQARDADRRLASQQKTKAGGWASKSLLEREMERERERQREWEAEQEGMKGRARDTVKEGTGQGQSWDVNQYGYMGGDNMNRGSSTGSGINFGGRRQILGPRPQK